MPRLPALLPFCMPPARYGAVGTQSRGCNPSAMRTVSPMPFRLAAAAVLALTVGAGCAPVQQETTMVEYRQNPRPSHVHRLEMRIEDAPGDFGWIQGFMQFDVVNRQCLPPPRENAGGYSSPIPTRSIPFELQRQPDGGYTGTVFTDGMVDEDYHGHGVCEWRLVNVQVQLKATGAPEETLFMADLFGDELAMGSAKTIHYIRESYPRHPDSRLDEPLSSGQTDRSQMAPEVTAENLFKIVMASQPVTQ